MLAADVAAVAEAPCLADNGDRLKQDGPTKNSTDGRQTAGECEFTLRAVRSAHGSYAQ